MKIVITDGYTLNPGDLSWRPFDQLGEVIYYDRTSPGEVKDRCRPANVIITNKTTISEETIDAAADLQLIAVTATGYNVVDIGVSTEEAFPYAMCRSMGRILWHSMLLPCCWNSRTR